jgi:hypothetical protein
MGKPIRKWIARSDRRILHRVDNFKFVPGLNVDILSLKILFPLLARTTMYVERCDFGTGGLALCHHHNIKCNCYYFYYYLSILLELLSHQPHGVLTRKRAKTDISHEIISYYNFHLCLCQYFKFVFPWKEFILILNILIFIM